MTYAASSDHCPASSSALTSSDDIGVRSKDRSPEHCTVVTRGERRIGARVFISVLCDVLTYTASRLIPNTYRHLPSTYRHLPSIVRHLPQQQQQVLCAVERASRGAHAAAASRMCFHMQGATLKMPSCTHCFARGCSSTQSNERSAGVRMCKMC